MQHTAIESRRYLTGYEHKERAGKFEEFIYVPDYMTAMKAYKRVKHFLVTRSNIKVYTTPIDQ